MTEAKIKDEATNEEIKRDEEIEKEEQLKEEQASEEIPKEESSEGTECSEKTGGKDAEAEESERYMRLMAEFQNYKRRSEKERNDIYSFANEKIVVQLLDVCDNFERALESGSKDEAFLKGMELIFEQFKGVLEKSGVKEIEALGADFDPNFHNAVLTEESGEYESGKVSGVLQKGYTLNDKVVRPAMVKVVQ